MIYITDERMLLSRTPRDGILGEELEIMNSKLLMDWREEFPNVITPF